MTDPLEIAALAEGIKPAFLGGQSPCPEDLLRDVAVVAERQGMHVRWSRGLMPYGEHITLDNIAACLSAGARGVAAIRLLDTPEKIRTTRNVL